MKMEPLWDDAHGRMGGACGPGALLVCVDSLFFFSLFSVAHANNWQVQESGVILQYLTSPGVGGEKEQEEGWGKESVNHGSYCQWDKLAVVGFHSAQTIISLKTNKKQKTINVILYLDW